MLLNHKIKIWNLVLAMIGSYYNIYLTLGRYILYYCYKYLVKKKRYYKMICLVIPMNKIKLD